MEQCTCESVPDRLYWNFLLHHMYLPFHCHHKFLILSSFGLYQYFANEEAISEVEIFKSAFLGAILLEILSKCFSVLLRNLIEPYKVCGRRTHNVININIISLYCHKYKHLKFKPTGMTPRLARWAPF
ncbi:Phosphoprotein phosphatase [Handroanthus impetiginosus]|uniref:Phosphoprotein phosphatase n=1 Tax=Handroanthus impetiginosus TaxID=429701 RepID=A0A2G9GCX6_9LAMI|nr:Phosphoprotein phosphatase [Handroanthus impetiginosus]